MRWVDRFFNKHKGARRLSLFVSLGLLIYITVQTLTPEALASYNAASASVVLGLIGALTTPVVVYKVTRGKEESAK